jgi:hypothetical protein
VLTAKQGNWLAFPYMPTLLLLAEFFHFYGEILQFRFKFSLFRFFVLFACGKNQMRHN